MMTEKTFERVTEFLKDLASASEYKSHPLGFEDSISRGWKDDAAELFEELTGRKP